METGVTLKLLIGQTSTTAFELSVSRRFSSKDDSQKDYLPKSSNWHIL